ncbi:MAG: hypothetical protein HND27_06295 [Bacteroidetes bacterium]|nr:hypothetical protein [Bacteroidota bacterium]MBV6459978.1 hypothetical protein [Flavobacteriales bacterium]WKZ76379.1 MAG: hypothetical protein QY303_05650 [Vicingaceae bacterium]MCL4816299.1 hypothetical protein [Flavobacteriales bacterium]NOG95373.1 hypothetical protein [Bacteroidota bacterium]
MLASSAISIFYIFVFVVLIKKGAFFKLKGVPIFFPIATFLLKILAGIILTLIYTHYYPTRNTADIFKYFDDSKVMYDAAFTNFTDFIKMLSGIGNDHTYFNEHYYNKMNWWYRQSAGNLYNDSHIIIRFNTLVRFFSFGQFNVHTIFMCFLSFAGCTALYKAFSVFIQNKEKQLFICVFLLPSVWFWSSGVLKEGIVFFAIGFLLYSFFSLVVLKKYKAFHFIVFLSGALLLFYLKFYLFASILPALIAFSIHSNKVFWKYLLVFLFYIAFILFVSRIHSPFSPITLLSEKQQAFLELAEKENAGSVVKVYKLENSYMNLIKNIPYAIKNLFLHPFVFTCKIGLELPAAIENSIFQIGLLFSFFFRNKLTKVENNFVWLCLSFSVFLFMLIGTTTPVLGAIVRYKTPALPFLFAVLLLLSNHSKLYNQFNLYKYFYEKLETFFNRFSVY